MDYEHLRYPEVIEKLAGMAGLSVPRMTQAEVEKATREQSLTDVLEAVTAWFEEQCEATSEGDVARRYLQERGLTRATIKRFRLGYAPESREALKIAMRGRGITERQLIDVGLLIQVEDKLPYARFRRRLMFPIRDGKGRVIGFGGRILPGEPNSQAPKYINSPETALFHKGRQLFNRDLARKTALQSGTLILCEGYMDVIALAQAGIEHAVAPLGTAVTPEQLQLAWQMVDEPTLCLDGDNAGQRAMQRVIDLALPLLAPGKTLRFAVLPQGEDPDSLVRHAGASAFKEVMTRAQPLAWMLWAQAMAGEATTPEARAAQEQSLTQKLALIKHANVQHYYRQFMREKLQERQMLYQKPRESGAGRHAGEGRYPSSGKSWTPSYTGATPGPVLLPPLPRNADQSLRVPATNLLALAIAQPGLLNDAAAEENWLMAPMPLPWQQQAHRILTEMHIASPQLGSEELWHQLEEELTPAGLAQITKAMEAFGIQHGSDAVTRGLRAGRLWAEVVNDVTRARLRVDIQEAQTRLAEDLSEDNLNRHLALKGQLEALERERSRFYLADPLPHAG